MKKIDFFAFFKNNSGQLVLVQAPNPPLILAGFFYLLSFASFSPLVLVSSIASKISLLYWAYLEIISGDSNFRKLLGVLVTIWTVRNLFQ